MQQVSNGTCAYEVGGDHWVIRFPVGDDAWELEIPGSAISGLPVRLHLGEVCSGRGVQASAKVSWRTYRWTLTQLRACQSASPQAADDCLRTLLDEAFAGLSAALRF
ncbi:hypothetical protein MLP_52700 [Microlunatus phosphovorus NM-1]|uniref:Uncharacterized protein n=1 Tax=Microlunatus phosphovorus (strain ATCC 700054 / DSM 10555 / JCM 9379 / NBRC 101784 / NCIMB 13414 / VKM Ac-1990 / NM-1) TaxID=1032480 RepID=F5XIP6_MICPN|nr:hypothetical protein MLP_52700 [Microlunatus phosphovorus NM-1]